MRLSTLSVSTPVLQQPSGIAGRTTITNPTTFLTSANTTSTSNYHFYHLVLFVFVRFFIFVS